MEKRAAAFEKRFEVRSVHVVSDLPVGDVMDCDYLTDMTLSSERNR